MRFSRRALARTGPDGLARVVQLGQPIEPVALSPAMPAMRQPCQPCLQRLLGSIASTGHRKALPGK